MYFYGEGEDLIANIKSFRGFTLAEVLITLVIIGVIAAMTIPTLMNNTNKQEYVSRLKKVYSTLSQATNKIITDEGMPRADMGAGLHLPKPYLICTKNISAIRKYVGKISRVVLQVHTNF